MRLISFFLFLLIFSAPVHSQTITYSERDRQDEASINFEVIGKIKGNFLVYKNIRWRHIITLYNNAMEIVEKNQLDFMPDSRTINVDFVVYPDFFYMIYQYQRKGIVYCMGVKMNDSGQTASPPVQLDTTFIGLLGDNKIYTTTFSEDKQKILVYKIYKKNDRYSLVTLLFDQELKLHSRSRFMLELDEHRDIYNELQVDNRGNTVFTKSTRAGIRENVGQLSLFVQNLGSDSLQSYPLPLEKNYIDDIKLKIDNLNKHYILNALYYKEKRGRIDGLFSYTWDLESRSRTASSFVEFENALRNEATTDGKPRFAFDDYFIRQVIVRKDGGYIMAAENYSSQTRGNNNWNRSDYLFGPGYSSPYYSPYSPYSYYYRPFGYPSQQTTRYYYDNIVVFGMDKSGGMEWNKVIHKEQYDDDNDNFLSYSTMTTNGELHFLFNNNEKSNQIIADNSLTATGELKRNPTLKSEEKGYQFMPRFCKQVGARQLIIPCIYKATVCFARVDY